MTLPTALQLPTPHVNNDTNELHKEMMNQGLKSKMEWLIVLKQKNTCTANKTFGIQTKFALGHYQWDDSLHTTSAYMVFVAFEKKCDASRSLWCQCVLHPSVDWSSNWSSMQMCPQKDWWPYAKTLINFFKHVIKRRKTYVLVCINPQEL